MIGKIVTCTLLLHLYRSYPPTETHWGLVEVPCIVEDSRGPHDVGDDRISLFVNCAASLKEARLTRTPGNSTKRWVIYEEDCF